MFSGFFRTIAAIVAFLFMAQTAALAAPATIESNAKQLYLIEDTTGTVLMSRDAQSKMFPSSMSKLMTLYVLFSKLKDGSVKLEDKFLVSEKAWRMGGSKMYVHVGDRVPVEDLIRGIIIQSGNDACIVVAEALGVTEAGFAGQMNEVAKVIGLKNSHFVNSTGWPDDNHYMTAEDLGILATRLIHDFPEYYHYFSEASYSYNGITQPNRNLLLNKELGVDGLKTGHTEMAGYGITLSAARDERRLILVVNGLGSEKERAFEGETLLQYGFSHFVNEKLLAKGETVDSVPVWFGAEESVPLVAQNDVMVTLSRAEQKNVKLILEAQSPVPAPVQEGAQLGSLKVMQGETELKTIPLFAGVAVEKAGFFSRIPKAASYYLGF